MSKKKSVASSQKPDEKALTIITTILPPKKGVRRLVISAAPEGEMSGAASNTTTVITLEDDLPFTVALASGDDVTAISTWGVEDSADGDLAVTCQGIVMGAQGVAADNYGWYLMEGVVKALSTAETITTFNPVVAAANTVDEFASDGQELWVGTALATYTSDNVATTLPVRMNLFSPAGVGLAP